MNKFMEKRFPHCLADRDYTTASLVAKHPPEITNANKATIHEIACPPGWADEPSVCPLVTVARWGVVPMPKSLATGDAAIGFIKEKLVVTEDVYNYDHGDPPASMEHWHVNFADGNLFGFYGGSLLAQDELQVAEHPALMSVREAMRAVDALNAHGNEFKPRTKNGAQPTPILVRGVDRRLRINTAKLYGNKFGAASKATVKANVAAITAKHPSNIISMAAPGHGRGPYTDEQIRTILSTAYSAFSAARTMTLHFSPDARVCVHTGNWGTGAFGGNPVIMALLQVAGADLAGLDLLHYHSFDEKNAVAVRKAMELYAAIRGRTSGAGVDSFIAEVLKLRLKWGLSNGT